MQADSQLCIVKVLSIHFWIMSTKSYILCPVSDKRTDEKVARINGLFTAGLITLFAVTGSIIPITFLVADFFLRSFYLSQYSPLAVTSRGIVNILKLNTSFINAGPKVFAARIGLFLSAVILLTYMFKLTVPAFAFAGILGLFSLLEGVLGICVACEIYPILYRLLFRVNFSR
jgi:hypothetical protein